MADKPERNFDEELKDAKDIQSAYKKGIALMTVGGVGGLAIGGPFGALAGAVIVPLGAVCWNLITLPWKAEEEIKKSKAEAEKKNSSNLLR